jgi:hypothetical protein
MITPAPTLGSQLYKIGDNITWAWNYTDVSATPTAIDVLVSISTTQVWTLTQNMTFAPTATFTWDTSDYASAVNQPLGTEQYTLVIYDAQSAVTAAGEAGYLAAFNGFQFGMYTPQPYQSFDEGWTCAVCSAAAGGTDRYAFGFALMMSIITVMSFTWFVTGL